MQVSVIIPTLQAENHLPILLQSLNTQNHVPSEIIIVDTCSTDQTQAIAKQHNCKIYTIQRKEFRHGKARNLGAKLAQGDILVFLTQDALPVHPDFLSQLIKPIMENIAAASTARQIAYPDANPIESYSREFNYPDESIIRTIDDLPKNGIKTYFFSNSASAIRRDIFLAQGGFAEDLIVDEDLEFCARLLNSGNSVNYCAEAKVYHSHNYTITQLFQRYFDIGVFFSQAGELLAGAETNPEGLRYLYQGIVYLGQKNYFQLIPRLILEAIAKYGGFKFGYYHHYIPDKYKRSLSGQDYYWES